MHIQSMCLPLAVRAVLAFVMAVSSFALPLSRPSIALAQNDIIVAESGGSTRVSETPGSTDAFTVRLSDRPDSNVVLSVTSSDTGEATINKSQLTFTPDDWNVPQTVTVSGVEDTEADGAQTVSIVLDVVEAQSDGDYHNKSAMVTVTVLDNEPQGAAGFTITESGGETRVNESGTTDTFTVVLNKQPATGQVTINVTSTNVNEVRVTDGAQMTFTQGNWNNPKTVTVQGVNDTISDGNQTVGVLVSVNQTLTDDPAYDAVPPQTVNVTNEDNETPTPGFVVVQSEASTTVNESGGTDTFTVRLTQQPTTNVVINVTSSDTEEVTVDKPSLTFTASNWNQEQTVTVTGVNDDQADGPQTVGVVLSVNDTLSAPEYGSVPDQTVQVTNQDNEPPSAGFTVSRSSLTVSESGSSETFTVVLTKQPASDVVLSVTSSDTGENTASPSQLTFTSANWNSPQTVTVTGVNDDLDDGDQTSTVTLSVVEALSDNEFDGAPDRTVTVTTTDNDPSAPGNRPVCIAPPDGTKLDNLGPALRWTQDPTTRWFQIQVTPFNSDGPGINLIISDTGLVAASQYQVKEPDFGGPEPNYVMLPDMTYTWRVRTAATASQPGESEWTSYSDPCRFETANKTSATISLVNPQEGNVVSSRNPILTWGNSDRTVFYYEVQVSKDSGFCSSPGCPMLYWELRHGGVTDPPNSYTIPSGFPLERGAAYHWRVRPRIQGDGTPVAWTPSRSFRVAP